MKRQDTSSYKIKKEESFAWSKFEIKHDHVVTKPRAQYRAAINNPKAWARYTPFYTETKGDVGPPLGDTGSSLGVSYMGAPKTDSFHVKLFNAKASTTSTTKNDWSARRFDFSIGKLLRLDMRLTDGDGDPRNLIFCAFRKTLAAVQQGKLATEVADLCLTKITQIRGFGFAKYLLIKAENPNCKCTITEAILVRLCAAHDRMWSLRTDTVECLRVQLFIDCMLDLSYYIQTKDRYVDDILSGSPVFLFYPHGQRFVHGGELPSMISSLMLASLWHEIRPTSKDLISLIIHIFDCKAAHHRCQNRNMVKILYDDTDPERSDSKKADGDPRLMGLLKDVIFVSMMGNYPHCNYRPGFKIRMDIRQSCLRFFKPPSLQTETLRTNWQWGIWWFQENRFLLRACIKEYHLYTILHQPAARSVLMASHNHADHEKFVFHSMDVARNMLESEGPDVFAAGSETRLSNLMEKIEREHEHAHKSALKFLTKLRKGSFVSVVRKKIKTWVEGKDGVRTTTLAMLACVDRHLGYGPSPPPTTNPEELVSGDVINLLVSHNLAKPIFGYLGSDPAPPPPPPEEIVSVDVISLLASHKPKPADLSSAVGLLRRSLLKMLAKAHPEIRENPRVQAERREIMQEILANTKGINAVTWVRPGKLTAVEQHTMSTETGGGMGADGFLLFRFLAVGVYRNQAHMKWPIQNPKDEAAFVDLLSKVAVRASKNRRHWFEMDWLILLGVSPEGLDHFRKLYSCYETQDIPDNRISNEFPIMFKRNMRDLALIFVFLDKIMSIRRTEVRNLDSRVAANQIEAARFRYKIPSWCLTPDDITTKRYCGGCGAWADVIVTPDSKASSVYATGLRAATFDAISGELRCKKGMTAGCRKPLIEIDLKGKAILISAVKRPPKWYTLCATCASLTVLITERTDYRGPNCGMHPVITPPAPITTTALAASSRLPPPYLRELMRARNNCGLKEKCLEQEEFLCAHCGLKGLNVNMHRVPVLDDRDAEAKIYPRVEMMLCRQDFNLIKRTLGWVPRRGAAATKNTNRVAWPNRSYILYSQILALVKSISQRRLLRYASSGMRGVRSIPEHRYPDKT